MVNRLWAIRLLLVVAFFVLQWILYQQLGVRVTTDGQRYIEWAQLWMSQRQVEPWGTWYFTYIIWLSCWLKMGFNVQTVVWGQILVAAISFLSLFELARRWSGSIRLALITAALYLLFVEISHWHFYILTESLFTSFIIFSLYAFLYFKGASRLWLIPLVLATAFMRPMGMLVLFAIVLVLIRKYFKRLTPSVRIVAVCILLILGYLGLERFLAGNPGVNFYYRHGQVVWDANTKAGLAQNPWLVVENEDVQYPERSASSVVVFFQFAMENPLFFVELTLKKMVMFIVHIKPYYSWKHNLWIALLWWPALILAMHAFWKRKGDRLTTLVCILFFSHVVMVGCTVESWDGRFLIPLLPPIFLVAVHELLIICGWVKKVECKE
jgi:hypothetical protein